MSPDVSIVIPVYNEGEAILPCLDRILRAVASRCELLVVYDSPGDTTVPCIEQAASADSRVRGLLNGYGPGPANAIRFGIDRASSPVTVITMADGSDDPRQIDDLARLVERGVVVAAASRYMPGGQQVGGPRLKRTLSRCAGKSLRLLARAGTRDATNSFKAYSTDFVRQVGIDSRNGFEIGLELTAKATRLRLPVAEIPTIWLDRALGDSRFQLARWLPGYLRWYRFAFGPRLSTQKLAARRGRGGRGGAAAVARSPAGAARPASHVSGHGGIRHGGIRHGGVRHGGIRHGGIRHGGIRHGGMSWQRFW